MQRLWDLVHGLNVRSKRMARDLGITGPQRLVLRVLGQSPELTHGELAGTLGMHPSTVTGILQRLERQRLIARLADPADRRRVRFQLTARGIEIDRARRGTVEAAVRRALQRAEPAMIEHAVAMVELLVAELARDD